MNVSRFEVNLFGENVYVLWNDATHHAIVVDPGMMRPQERDEVVAFIDGHQLQVKRLLLTHCHVDHSASARFVADRYGVGVEASPLDAPLAQHLPEQAAFFHLKVEVSPLLIDSPLNDGDVIMLDDDEIHVLATPGHTPGGLSFYIPSKGLALVGDSLFRGSVGRTDLPGGDHNALIASIKSKLLSLPAAVTLAPGHGPATTVADEKSFNPYIQ